MALWLLPPGASTPTRLAASPISQAPVSYWKGTGCNRKPIYIYIYTFIFNIYIYIYISQLYGCYSMLFPHLSSLIAQKSTRGLPHKLDPKFSRSSNIVSWAKVDQLFALSAGELGSGVHGWGRRMTCHGLGRSWIDLGYSPTTTGV